MSPILSRTRLPRSLVKLAHHRAAHSWPSHAQGLSAVLEKKADDVVITFALRTAMGKAKKGQLKDTPVDAMLAAVFKVCVPELFRTGC